MVAEQRENGDDGLPRERRPFRVLVIGDNGTGREIIIRNIRRAWPFEYQLEWENAADGDEAMMRLTQDTFTLVIFDWQMPGEGGMRDLRKLRAGRGDIPMIVISEANGGDIAEDLESLGAAFIPRESISPTTLRDAAATSARWLADKVARDRRGRKEEV